MAMAGIEISEELSQRVVTAYRSKFWRVKQLWYDQEKAAMEAMVTWRPVTCGYATWIRKEKFLYCQLPSGRRLAYAMPKVEQRTMSWGETKASLSYMGVNSITRKWQRQTSYGGLLVENITQAVARDLIAAALVRCEDSIYKPVLTVHDEVISEAPLGQGSVKEFEELVSEVPEWALGCPVAAEGWSGLRYRK
jgi:DNA polymerase